MIRGFFLLAFQWFTFVSGGGFALPM